MPRRPSGNLRHGEMDGHRWHEAISSWKASKAASRGSTGDRATVLDAASALSAGASLATDGTAASWRRGLVKAKPSDNTTATPRFSLKPNRKLNENDIH